MTQETPQSHPSIGYRILQEEEVDTIVLSPIPFQEESPAAEPSHKQLALSNTALTSPRFLQNEDNDGYTPLPFSRRPVLLNGLNCLNAVAYVILLIVSCMIGLWGLGGMVTTPGEALKENETLVTPAFYVHWISIPILMAEGIFAGAQLLPEFRAHPMVQEGTGYFFFYTCLCQVALTLFGSFRLWIGSVISAVLALSSLLGLLASQHASHMGGLRSRHEYWLFRFPFLLHCGWILVLTIVYVSVLVRYHTSNAGTQLAINVVALALLLSAVVHCLSKDINISADLVIPAVILWSYIGIAVQLHRPNEVLVSDYGHVVVEGIRLSTYIFGGITLLLMAPRILVLTCHEFFTIHVVTMLDDSYTE